MLSKPIDSLENTDDRHALRSLIDAYARCADRRDASGQMALFTDNCRLLVFYDARSDEPSQTYLGRVALAPVFDALNAYEATTHFNGQSSITLDGDHANGESYCLAHHILRKGSDAELMVASIRYVDTFVRTDAGWRFSERKLMVDWIETRPLNQQISRASKPRRPGKPTSAPKGSSIDG